MCGQQNIKKNWQGSVSIGLMGKCRMKVHNRSIVCVILIFAPHSVIFQYVSRNFFSSNYCSVPSTVQKCQCSRGQACNIAFTFSFRCSNYIQLEPAQLSRFVYMLRAGRSSNRASISCKYRYLPAQFPDTLWPIQLTIQCVSIPSLFSQGLKRPWREGDL